jgi:hypothetical protein
MRISEANRRYASGISTGALFPTFTHAVMGGFFTLSFQSGLAVLTRRVRRPLPIEAGDGPGL